MTAQPIDTALPGPDDPYWDTFDEWVDLYLRMSLDRSGNELGVDRQEAEAREYAAKLGLPVRRIYMDNNKSATRDDVIRHDFEQSLVDAKARRDRLGAGRYTTILCWHSDRYARRVKDLLRVNDSNILIRGLHSGYFDLSTPAGVATAITVTAWAEYEGKQKSLRQKAAHRQRAQDGRHFWTQRPFGLNFDGTLNKPEATALAHVYRMVLNGMSLNACVAYLNNKGLPTVKGNQWQATPLRNVLLHTRNCGILSYLGVEIGPGQWEKIVDEETYRAAVRVLTDNKRLMSPRSIRSGRGGRQSIMPGFAQCGVCDDTVSTYNADGYRLYRCRKGHASARADEVDDRAAALILERFTRPDVAGRFSVTDDARRQELHDELDRLRARSDEYALKLDEESMTMSQFETLNRRNMERIAAAERELAGMGLDKSLAELLDVPDLVSHWENTLTVHEKHVIVASFFEKIVMHPRGKGGNRFKPALVEYWIMGETTPRT